MKLPTLFKKTSTGAIEQWTIFVERGKDSPHYSIITEHGQLKGKLITSVEVVTEGKNLGKANETTIKDQAESQAQSEWNTKKTRKGYTEDMLKAMAGNNDGAGGIRPMLAKDYAEHKAKIKFPCAVQPKLDGIRCIAVVGPESPAVTLWSREQKPILACPHIAEAVAALLLPPGTVLDGELYNHDLKDDFEKIVSCVRKPYPAAPEEQAMIQYHIYDIPRLPGEEEKMPFSDRTRHLFGLLVEGSWGSAKLVDECLHYVETVGGTNIKDEDDLIRYRKLFQAAGYEGAMARNLDSLYEEGRRSPHLQKLKEFLEDDFPIVGVKEGKGKMAGCGIFTCEVPGGLTFDVKMEGKLEDLRQYVTDHSTWKDKKLTVKYFSMTKRGVPRFPVGKVVRDYE